MGTTTFQRGFNCRQLEEIEFFYYRLNKSFGTVEKGGKRLNFVVGPHKSILRQFRKKRRGKEKEKNEEAEAKEKKKKGSGRRKN
jgi:hypothetical protein